VFIGAHESSTTFFDHCGAAYKRRRRGRVSLPDGTSLPFEDEFSQKAMDYVINAILVDSDRRDAEGSAVRLEAGDCRR
jgi:hypothetical protein